MGIVQELGVRRQLPAAPTRQSRLLALLRRGPATEEQLQAAGLGPADIRDPVLAGEHAIFLGSFLVYAGDEEER